MNSPKNEILITSFWLFLTNIRIYFPFFPSPLTLTLYENLNNFPPKKQGYKQIREDISPEIVSCKIFSSLLASLKEMIGNQKSFIKFFFF